MVILSYGRMAFEVIVVKFWGQGIASIGKATKDFNSVSDRLTQGYRQNDNCYV